MLDTETAIVKRFLIQKLYLYNLSLRTSYALRYVYSIKETKYKPVRCYTDTCEMPLFESNDVTNILNIVPSNVAVKAIVGHSKLLLKIPSSLYAVLKSLVKTNLQCVSF